ncbi:MAG: hypothetical protein WC828_04210 [Thermoleophilia bacterium]|jgi:hypothetical protein
MAVAHPKKFMLGLVMLIGFFAVVVMLFMPIYGTANDGNGKNAFNVLDGLYNSVSKGSSEFNTEVGEKITEFNGQEVSFTSKAKAATTDKVAGAPTRGEIAKPEEMAKQMVKLVQTAGGEAKASEKDGAWSVKVSGDFGKILASALEDSKAMYDNDGQALVKKYGFDAENAMNDWWLMFNSPQTDMNKEGGEAFEQSKMLKEINEKSIEPAYNYYTIQAESPSSKALPIALSLGGYVLYTVWYGFSLLFMFEGWGLKLEH